MDCSKAKLWSRRVLRCVLGLVLIYAAYRKFSEPWIVFATAIDSYGVLPNAWAIGVARALPWFEGPLGLVLLSGIFMRATAITTATLLGAFFTLMAYSYASGKAIDCGCFGSGEVLGPATVVRDGVLLAIALALAFLTRRRLRELPQT